jgi:hypothetical protein
MRRGNKETYHPPPTVRTKPTWSDNISDDVLRDVLDELYSALNVSLNHAIATWRSLRILAAEADAALADRRNFRFAVTLCTPQPFIQFRPPPPARSIANRYCNGLLLTDQHNKPLATGNTRIE